MSASPGQAERGGIATAIPPSTPTSRSVGSRQGNSEHSQRQANGQQNTQAFQQVNVGQGVGASGVTQAGGFAPGILPGQVPTMPGVPQACFASGQAGFAPDLVTGFGCGPSHVQRAQLPSTGMGNFVGGLTPQAAQVHQVVNLVEAMGPNEVRVLHQILGERMASSARMVPEMFGERPAENVRGAVGFVPDSQSPSLPLRGSQPPAQGSATGQNSGVVDVFAKSEKWLAPAPTPDTSKWTTREAEILGWSDYLSQLISWSAQGSLDFSNAISHASRWPTVVQWQTLSQNQKARATRLVAVLRSAFVEHGRTSMLINAFLEGINLQDLGGHFTGLTTHGVNGFELLRQLTLEYSLRTRSEALSLRTALAGRSFVLNSSESSASTIVSDTIRRIDYEAARFAKLIGTLPAHVDQTGLGLPEPDLLVILMRSLPEAVRQYALHHASGESYGAYRQAARRWEEQQRLFSEALSSFPQDTHGKRIAQLDGSVEWYSMDATDSAWTWEHMDAVQNVHKCFKCGSKKHETKDCSVDVSKLKCFRCGKYGHVSMNCQQAKGSGFGKSKGKGKEVIKGNQWEKGKGKKGLPGTKGKSKGKLNEMSHEWDPLDAWWYGDDDWYSGWEVSQVWSQSPSDERWYDANDWYNGRDTEEVPQVSNETTYRQEPTEEQTVGSLILAPVVCDDLHFAEFSLVFEDGVSSCVSFSCGHEGRTDSAALDVGQDYGLVSGDETHINTLKLTSPVSARVELVHLDVSTFLNTPWNETVSLSSEARRWMPSLGPLLSEVIHEDSTWWLLDSGASATVLAQSCCDAYGVNVPSSCMDQSKYRAANGSPVEITGQAEFSVWMFLRSEQQDEWKKAQLKCLVGNIRHNIISTTLLCKSGWYFKQEPNGFSLEHAATHKTLLETAYFAGCPWVRLCPAESSSWESHFRLSQVHDTEQRESTFSPGLNPLSRATEQELAEHRIQGHVPHHPQCIECARGHSVFQHRRRTKQGLETEIQADFCFLKREGERFEFSDKEGNMKVLVLVELATNCVGYVVVSDDVTTVRKQIVSWLEHFGVVSSNTSVILHTDAEKAVGELVAKGSTQYSFQIRRASAQQHQSIGGAERCVRRLKEGLAILRADLNGRGVDVIFNSSSMQDVLNYLALSHNHFSVTPGTKKSPLETSCGRQLSKPTSSLYGCTVLAELSDAVKAKAPGETRSVEAAFVHVGLSHGPLVQGLVRVEGGHELMRFHARNVKVVLPLQWKLEMCSGLLQSFATGASQGPAGTLEAGTSGQALMGQEPKTVRFSESEAVDVPDTILSRGETGLVDVEGLDAGSIRKLKAQPVKKTHLKPETTLLKPALKKQVAWSDRAWIA